MSFNVRWDGLDHGRNAWANRLPVVVKTIQTVAPDVIGLQEPSAAQLRDLDDALGAYASFRGDHERDEHIPILYLETRFDRESAGSFWLVETSDLSGGTRRCAWVRLVDRRSGRALYVYNVHFDHRSATSRRHSAQVLANAIRHREHPDPFVVVGDFNEREDGAAIRYLTDPAQARDSGITLVDTFRDRYPSRRDVGSAHSFTGKSAGNERFDYVFVSRQDRIVDAQIIPYNVDGLYPSDHFPAVARIRFP